MTHNGAHYSALVAFPDCPSSLLGMEVHGTQAAHLLFTELGKQVASVSVSVTTDLCVKQLSVN